MTMHDSTANVSGHATYSWTPPAEATTPDSTRWSPERIYEFPQWVRNDADKIRSKPGYVAMTERIELAADLLDAVIATHLSCALNVCPTRQAIHRVIEGGKS